MFRPQKVYLNAENNQVLTFDLFTDIQPIVQSSKMKPEKQSNKSKHFPPLDNQAEAMEASIGQVFDSAKYLNSTIAEPKVRQKALQILTYLQANTDPSVVRFESRGGIFYKSSLVPDAILSDTLKSIVTKNSKTLQQGEFYLLSLLANAPPAILKMINPAKLKLCNIQQHFSATGLTGSQTTPPSKPNKLVIPPSTGHQSNVEFRTANPFVFRPTFKQTSAVIAKPPTAIPKKRSVVTGVQKKYNAKNIPTWYKVL